MILKAPLYPSIRLEAESNSAETTFKKPRLLLPGVELNDEKDAESTTRKVVVEKLAGTLCETTML